jgi:epoxyqueuosine reductase
VYVARYARGRDYHLVLQKRLKRLASALVTAGVCGRAHWFVDTAPVLERAWAEAAGLGWIGKNACLIHPGGGSFLALAGMVLDVPLASGTPAANRCGSCRRCMDACPTGALIEPGVVDARRCLATWTIECRGATPRELWPLQKDYVFGCDVCQAVCPHNAASAAACGDEELSAPRPWQALTLAECIAMTKAQFDRAFAASPMRRAGWEGMRLNAITVAGNCGSGADCQPALQACLTDGDAEIRERARWAVERVMSDESH